MGQQAKDGWVDQEADVAVEPSAEERRYDVKLGSGNAIEWTGPWAIDQMAAIERFGKECLRLGMKKGFEHLGHAPAPYLPEDYGR